MDTLSGIVDGSTPSTSQSTSAASRQIAARVDRLPVTSHLWWLVLLISLGGVFEIYDLIFTGYIAPGMGKSGLMATTTATFFGFKGFAGYIFAMFAGLFVGTFGLGFLPDKFGRRSVFTWSLIWYSVGAAIMALQTSAEGIVIWRFISGIGVGVEIVTIDVYITELVPQHMRGRAIAFNQTVMFVSAPIAAILSYWLVPTTVWGLDGWRWVVLIGSIGAVVVWYIRLRVPESPRWLTRHGRIEEADRIVTRMEDQIERESGASLPEPQPLIERKLPTTRFADVWKPPYRSRTLMLVAFNLFQAVGYYGFANWVPTLLIGQGITITKSLFYAFIIAFALPIGTLLALVVADKIERKWLIVIPALAVVVFGSIFGQLRNPVLLTICGVLISLSGQIISPSYHAYQAELFPIAIRGRANGLVYSASRIGAMLSGFVIAWLLRNYGVAGVFAGITVCMLIVALSIGIWGPRTNGIRLDELSH